MNCYDSNFFLCERLKSRVSFIPLKPTSDIFLCGSSLSAQPESALALISRILRSHRCFKACDQM